MRCSTTAAFARGTVSPPPRSTRPLTLTDCPASGAPPQSTPSSRAALRRELAEIFRIEVLEVGLQRVGIERAAAGARLDRAFTRIDGGQLEQRLARQDRRLEPERERDRVRGTGVDLNDGVAALDVQLGEIGVVLP